MEMKLLNVGEVYVRVSDITRFLEGAIATCKEAQARTEANPDSSEAARKAAQAFVDSAEGIFEDFGRIFHDSFIKGATIK